MKQRNFIRSAWLLVILSLVFAAPGGSTEVVPAPGEVLALMERVAGWQIANPDSRPRRPRTGWIHAAYTFGAMELANLSSQPRYFEALIGTGRANSWQLGSRPYHADDHAIGQLYLSLYARERDPAMLAPTRTRFDTILAHRMPDNFEHDSAINPRRKLLGVEPLAAAFSTISIRPQIAALARASGRVPTIRGPVKVSWQRRERGYECTVQIPANTRAIVALPGHDDAVFTESGGPATEAAGVTSVRNEGDRVLFAVGAGSYTFVCATEP